MGATLIISERERENFCSHHKARDRVKVDTTTERTNRPAANPLSQPIESEIPEQLYFCVCVAINVFVVCVTPSLRFISHQAAAAAVDAVNASWSICRLHTERELMMMMILCCAQETAAAAEGAT